MVDTRRHGQMDAGRSQLILPDYESHHSPLKAVTQNDSIVEALAKLDERAHLSLTSLNGASPYYHVSEDIFNALRTLDGHIPNLDNFFLTQDWFANFGIKIASGYINYNGEVHLDTGTVIGGSYTGSSNFDNAKIIVTGMALFDTSTTNGGQSQFNYEWLDGFVGKKFKLIETTFGQPHWDGNTRFQNPFDWLAVGI